MDHKLDKTALLFFVIALTASSCTVPEEIADTANQRFNQSIDWNNKHSFREIVVQSDDYSIMSTGDCHAGDTINLDSFFNIAKATSASAIVIAGDLTTGHEKDYNAFEQYMSDQDSLPVFLVAGNHDLFFDGWKEFYSRFGSSTYLFTVKTPYAIDLFICLETGGGTLGDKQLNWLINILQTIRPQYRHCMVFTHNNLIRSRHTDSTNPPVEELEVLLDLFAKHKVDMVITGHDHKHDAVQFGPTTYIIMDAIKDGYSDAGYLEIGVKNYNIMFNFKTL